MSDVAWTREDLAALQAIIAADLIAEFGGRLLDAALTPRLHAFVKARMLIARQLVDQPDG